MAKKTKRINKAPKIGAKAPVVETKEEKVIQQEGKVETAKVETVLPKTVVQKTDSMSQDAKVRYADLLQRRYIEHPIAEDAYTPEFISGINSIIDATVMSVAIDESVNGTGTFSMIVKRNPASYKGLLDIAKNMGITNLPELAALPAPTKQEQAKAGIQEENKEDLAVVQVTKENISKEVKSQAKAEKTKAAETVEVDPTKIKTDEELSQAIQHIFVRGSKSPFNTIDCVLKFIQSYLKIQAGEDKDKLAKLNSYTTMDYLDIIRKYAGKPTLVFNGIGQAMVTFTSVSKSPIFPFLMLYNSSRNKNTGIPSYDDQRIADIVKFIISWNCEDKVNSYKESIAAMDVEKNKNEIEKCNNAITHYTNILKSLANPDFSIVDHLMVAFHDNSDEYHKDALRIVNGIIKAFYGDIDMTVTYSNLDYNITQYAGIITNYFVTPAYRNTKYDESNLSELVPYKPEEEKDKDEEQKKQQLLQLNLMSQKL